MYIWRKLSFQHYNINQQFFKGISKYIDLMPSMRLALWCCSWTSLRWSVYLCSDRLGVQPKLFGMHAWWGWGPHVCNPPVYFAKLSRFYISRWWSFILEVFEQRQQSYIISLQWRHTLKLSVSLKYTHTHTSVLWLSLCRAFHFLLTQRDRYRPTPSPPPPPPPPSPNSFLFFFLSFPLLMSAL